MKYFFKKPGKKKPIPFKKINLEMSLISAMADAFRGHGFSLLVTAFLRGLPLMLFPQKSPPPLQSTGALLEMNRLVRRDKTTV
ncbi:hypothetical protein ACFVR1_02070 [Psychrobacillus sp. NPDC058041]|uniref:hypothetical protein n=1 Tax=Psychrobacillus sp. NPDC058041 TaxID=3346310 RepID=UPI0036D85807